MNVMSLRLSPEEQRHILKWAKQQKKDKSQAARELLEYGWRFALLEAYRRGKLSLELLAKELGVPVSEAMDFLASYGASAHLDYDDYLQGVERLRKII
jgi:predicted HTH domain antitoxin